MLFDDCARKKSSKKRDSERTMRKKWQKMNHFMMGERNGREEDG